MNYLISQKNLGDRITCDSAGTSSYHIGSPPDSRMVATAKKRGMEFKGQARQFKPADFDQFDLILAMDRENYWHILSLDTEKKYQDKVKMMCDFCRSHKIKEVPDPYYGGPEGFNHVIDLLMDACHGLLEDIETRHLPGT